jgi:hypothetical protein
VSESPEQPTKRRWVWKALLGIFALGGAVVLADWWSVQPRGSDVPKIVMQFLYMGSTCFIPVAVIAGLVFAFFGHNESKAHAMFAWSGLLVLALAVFLFARGLGQEIRIRGFHAIADSSEPLIAAIDAYTRDQGTPPEDLAELIPEYLDEIPGTGLAAYPRYYYFWSESKGRWRLAVSVCSGFEWGHVAYMPEQDHYERWQRIGDWVFVPD